MRGLTLGVAFEMPPREQRQFLVMAQAKAALAEK